MSLTSEKAGVAHLCNNYMKGLGLFFLVLFLAGQLSAQPRTYHPNEAFGEGEYTQFRVYYNSAFTGNVTAGEATIKVETAKKKYFDKEVWKIVGEGVSKGAFNWFYKVRNRYESYVDKQAIIPYLFVRHTREGGYSKDDEVFFYHDLQLATSRTATKKIPSNVHDFVSALYFMRTLNLSEFDGDSSYYLDFFLDDSVYVSKIKYVGTETIKVDLGTFRCLKFAPMMATGNVFADAYPMFVWVTDDKNHLPILAETKVVVGSVKMELTAYKNLRNPLSSKLKD
ncbi:MAG: hypothetical protein FD155_175 [Bacteroidetes bacterium]|nr:MAG: hypothetical protein FD155_175 [Bacteroidota bacterium]